MPRFRLRRLGRPIFFPRGNLARAVAFAEAVARRGGRDVESYHVALDLGISPGSSTFRTMVSSAAHYGLIERDRGKTAVSLSELGQRMFLLSPQSGRDHALLEAALTPPVFRALYDALAGRKIPSKEILVRRIVADLGATHEEAGACTEGFVENMRFLGAIVDSPNGEILASDFRPASGTPDPPAAALSAPTPARGLYVISGARNSTVDPILTILHGYGVPYRRVRDNELPSVEVIAKLLDEMDACSGAIAIIGPDESAPMGARYPDANVLYELGIATGRFRDRLLLIQDRRVDLPLGLAALPRIEFSVGDEESLGPIVLDRLVSQGLVKLTPGDS